MNYKRAAGIICHPTSFPSKYGIGDLGAEAYKFIDFLQDAGQTIWQIFPLGPTGYGDSPYQCFSAFAGSSLIISPEILKLEGLLTDEDLAIDRDWNSTEIDFGPLIDYKNYIHRKAFKKFIEIKGEESKDFISFCEKHKEWLNDYALFIAAKNYHGGSLWTEWKSKDIALRTDGAVEKWTAKLSEEIIYQKFLQFNFYKQWSALRKYANKKGINIVGDLPIFIAYDSADLWANKNLFTVDENGKLIFVAGVPPDYFSPTGQLWGNPLYRWEEMMKDDFAWWRKRISSLLELVDIIRIDHFRGFDAYWEIPGDAKTAQTGKWVKAPGEMFFNSIKKHLGDVPIIAEDLGIITKSVTELREKFGFPGMKILQFAFGTDMERKFLPHNFETNCVVHTGSHDNDTTRAYFEKLKHDNSNDIFSATQNYLNYYGDDIVFELIRVAYSSVANFVVIPLQDVLNLGNEARMNFPGTLGCNWKWRFEFHQLSHNLAKTYKRLTEIYERPSRAKIEEVKIEIENRFNF